MSLYRLECVREIEIMGPNGQRAQLHPQILHSNWRILVKHAQLGTHGMVGGFGKILMKTSTSF